MQNIVFKGKTDAIYKVIVIGDPGTEKTELLRNYASNQFEENYLPTVGVSILKEPVELKKYNATINLMFWDIAGQPQFYLLHRPYFNGADGIILVFDVTRSSTFSNINNWYNSAVKYGLSGIPKILIGNKAHLRGERKIILPMAEHLAEKLNIYDYYETSHLTGFNVKDVFEKISELIYQSKTLNKPIKVGKVSINPYQGEYIDIPEKIPSHEGIKFKRPEYTIPESNWPSPSNWPPPTRHKGVMSKKEKMNKNKKKKYEQKEKAKLEKEKKKKEISKRPI